MDAGPALNHPPPDAGGGDDEIECSLHPRGRTLDLFALGNESEIVALAEGATRAQDRDLPCDSKPAIKVLSFLLRPLPEGLARADEDPVPLVVEIRTGVDELVVGVGEI